MKTLILICLFWILAGCPFEGNGAKRSEENANNYKSAPNVAAKESPTPLEQVNQIDVSRKDFLGCWSSGNGLVMRITDGEIFLSTNSFRPVKYVEYKLEDNRLVLKLPDRPQFYFFQQIISLELQNQPEDGIRLTIKDYLNSEDFETQEKSGISGWVQDDCNKWFGHKKS